MARNDNKPQIAKMFLYGSFDTWPETLLFQEQTPQNFCFSNTPKGLGIYLQAIEMIVKIIFYCQDPKFECDLSLLLRAKPYANAKHMSQQRALTVKKSNHDLGCISKSAADTLREAIPLQPGATSPLKVECRNQTKQLCHHRTETAPSNRPAGGNPGDPQARTDSSRPGTRQSCMAQLLCAWRA